MGQTYIQQGLTCSKLTIETTQQQEISVQSQHWMKILVFRGVFIIKFALVLCFVCFHWRLWTSKYQLGCTTVDANVFAEFNSKVSIKQRGCAWFSNKGMNLQWNNYSEVTTISSEI